jgi:DNA-binding XRE family transcriptional regulator
MKTLFSNSDVCNYLRILNILKEKRVKIYTQKEIAELLEVSRKKMYDFEKGKVIDFELLTQYAAINGKEIVFNLI